LHIFLDRLHLCLEIDFSGDVGHQQLTHAPPVGWHLPALALLGLDLVEGEQGGVDDGAGEPIEGWFVGPVFFIVDGALPLAGRGEYTSILLNRVISI
jgi:hypothetical protein